MNSLVVDVTEEQAAQLTGMVMCAFSDWVQMHNLQRNFQANHFVFLFHLYREFFRTSLTELPEIDEIRLTDFTDGTIFIPYDSHTSLENVQVFVDDENLTQMNTREWMNLLGVTKQTYLNYRNLLNRFKVIEVIEKDKNRRGLRMCLPFVVHPGV